MSAPDYNAVDICVAVSRAFPNPDNYLPSSAEGKLIAIVSAYIAAHRNDLPAVIPPPMDGVIRTETKHAA